MVLIVLAYASSMESLNKIIWTYVLALGMLSTWTLIVSVSSRMSIDERRYDPNDTALQFLLVLPFVAWKYMSVKGIKKLLLGVLCLLLVSGIVATESRGGFIGLLAVTMVIISQVKRVEGGKLL